ncbi:MAG: 5'/3'-nucleotidase SurE [Spirochaetota bacterium]
MNTFRTLPEPLILVTNDDGIESPGLAAAVRAVVGLGRLVVVAPTTQQTSRGRSMIGNMNDVLHRVTLEQLAADVPDLEAYHLDASPALAVQHAMNTIFAERWPDFVVSGVNYGENLGMDITISGTVGAAFQASAYGIPGIAASQAVDIEHHYTYGHVDWEGSTRVVRKYAEVLLARLAGLPNPAALSGRARLAEPRPFPFDVLKIDAPSPCPPGTPERLSRLARRHYFTFQIDDPTHESSIGSGRTAIDMEPAGLRAGDDIHTLAHEHAVAITPLTLDFTASLEASAEVLGLVAPGEQLSQRKH